MSLVNPSNPNWYHVLGMHPTSIANVLAKLKGGQGYTTNETVLLDAFWTVFMPGGSGAAGGDGMIDPPLRAPVGEKALRAFEKKYAKWGMSVAKAAQVATTDVLSTFGMNTYSKQCYFKWYANACALAYQCMLPVDLWAKLPEGKSERTGGDTDDGDHWDDGLCPSQSWYTGTSGERWWKCLGRIKTGGRFCQ